MRSLMAALMLGLVTALGMTSLPTPSTAAPSAASRWVRAGTYRSYDAAWAKAKELRRSGHSVKIQSSGGYYSVYYR